MNFDITFCAAKCSNVKCRRMISYSQTKHAERIGKPLSFADFSDGCKDYIEIPTEKDKSKGG